jgi:flagellar motor switch protein FliG
MRTFTGVERAAVLMMLVGEEEAAAILQKLDPEEVRQLGKARSRSNMRSTISSARHASAPRSVSTRVRGSRR